jgi:hypothetical protein
VQNMEKLIARRGTVVVAGVLKEAVSSSGWSNVLWSSRGTLTANNTRESLSHAGLDPVLGTCHWGNFQMTGNGRIPKTRTDIYVPGILPVPWLTTCSHRP